MNVWIGEVEVCGVRTGVCRWNVCTCTTQEAAQRLVDEVVEHPFNYFGFFEEGDHIAGGVYVKVVSDDIIELDCV